MTRFCGRLLLEARVRAAPRYRRSPDSPERDSGTVDFVSRDHHTTRAFRLSESTVRLVNGLRRPAIIPPSRASRRAVARLVLDGLLEVERDRRFLSGPAAHRLFFPQGDARVARGVIARLSLDALAYAASLRSVGAGLLASRLYRYHARPISPGWRRRFPDDRAVERFVTGDSTVAAVASGVWLVSEGRHAIRPAFGEHHFKLYVSPAPAETPMAYRVLGQLLVSRHAPFSIKVARDLPTLLRSDRMVAYFAELDELRAAAAWLRTRLDGVAVHGVPFTAALGADGLLSWGVDLASGRRVRADDRNRSWRGWVTTRLGQALAAAGELTPQAAVRFALDRVSLDEVNTSAWRPTAALIR